MAEPKIYTKNYINEDCTIISSHGSTFNSRLYDRDKDSKFISVGANDDATEIILEITFKEGTSTVERDIDTVMLLNHNLADPEFEYWDGSAWQPLDSDTGVTEDVTIFEFETVSTEKIRLMSSITQSTDAEKFIGELIACALIMNIGLDLSANDITGRQKAFEVTLGDGSIHRSVVMHSLTRSEKYTSRVQLEYLTVDLLELLRTIKSGGEAFLWQPESSSRPDEIYLVNWTGSFSHRYMSDYKGAGFKLDMNLVEV